MNWFNGALAKRKRALANLPTLALVAALLPNASDAQEFSLDLRTKQADSLIVKYRDVRPAPNTAATTSVSERDAKRLSKLQQVAGLKGLSLTWKRSTQFGASVLSVGTDTPVDELSRLGTQMAEDDPDIEYAIADRRIQLAYLPNDPLFAQQWNLQSNAAGVNAPTSYDWMTERSLVDATRPIVAIIDTGYRPHVDLTLPYFGPSLAGQLSPLDTGDSTTYNQCGPGTGATTSSWHGMTVQGIVGGLVNNSTGIASVAGGSVGIWQARAFGPCGGVLSTYIDAINAAVTFRSPYGQRVRVINLSQGGVDTPCDIPLQQAVNNAVSNGVMVIASAGNGERRLTGSGQYEQIGIDASRSAPGNCSGVLSIAATDRYGSKTQYSNFGSIVALSAPGGDNKVGTVQQDRLISTSHALTGQDLSGTTSSYYSKDVAGTSFSAPHVSGAAALVFAKNPTLSVAQVKQILTSTAKPFVGVCNGCGSGILDAGAALQATPSVRINPPNCQTNPRLCARPGDPG